MPKTVIFLGAGASVAEGASLQVNLFKDYFKSKRERHDKIDKHLTPYFKQFWHIDLLADDLDLVVFPTFEEALGMLEMARERSEGFQGFYSNPNSNSIGHTIEDLVFLIAQILHERLQHNVFHSKLIEILNNKDKLHEVTFISLNYDILVDNAIASVYETKGIDLDYAIDFANFSCNGDWHVPQEGRAVELLKVHGSLNWLYCPVCKSIWLTPKEKGVIELISGDESKKKCKSCGGRKVPVLVPPTYFKVMSNPYLVAVWEKAEQCLRQCSQIIFCGYSLPDADIHIKYLLKRGQLNRQNAEPKVTVINHFDGKDQRASQEEENRYNRLFGRETVRFLDTSFQDFSASPEIYLG
jgi:NAD-dependent SIR2 family protein deacetylase